jgi:hypothetical protein
MDAAIYRENGAGPGERRKRLEKADSGVQSLGHLKCYWWSGLEKPLSELP